MPTETTLAAQLAEDAAERFLRYVRIDTRSDEDSDTYPSTPGQLDLLRLLRDELEQVGLADVTMDEHGYVTGTLPATVEHEVPTIAFFAHVDTAREVSGAGVSPQRVRYEGGEIVLGDSGQAIRPEESPQLENHVGHELITTDGTTLLGADDKAGVAEIMAAVAHLVAQPEIPHGTRQGRVQPRRGGRARRHPLPGRELRRDGRLHRRRLDDRRAAGRDVLRRAGAHAHPRPRDPSRAGRRASS